MLAAWAIALKDMRLLVRDRMGFFFAFFFPLIVAIFFGVIFSGGSRQTKIGVIVVDADGSMESQGLAAQIAEDPQLAVETAVDRNEAVDRVRGGKSTAAIIIPEGFGKEQSGMFFSTGAEVELAVDPARFAERGMLEGLLLKHGFLRMQRAFRDPETARAELNASRSRLAQAKGISTIQRLALGKLFNDVEGFLAATTNNREPSDDAGDDGSQDLQGSPPGWEPMRIRTIDVTQRAADAGQAVKKPPNSFAVTFPQGIIWGVMGCALGFSISLVAERSRGTLIRLRVAPISPGQILMGKAIACFLTTLAVSGFLIAIGVAGFGVWPTSWPILIVSVVCTGFCFVGIMMLLAVLSPSERSSSGLGWGVLLLLSMIGGGMLPLLFMPDWMKSLSVISPIRWSILAIEGGLWRGSGWSDILLPCAILLFVGGVGLLAGSTLLRKEPSL